MNGPDNLPSAFRYNYRVFFQFGRWKQHWEIVGPKGGIHFHLAFYKGEEPSCGLEIHWRSPPPYMAERAPSHDHCDLIKCPCWHDGTSLYAQESLYPCIDPRNPLDFFRHLVEEMKRFSKEDVQ